VAGPDGQIAVQINNASFHHQRHDPKGLVFIPLREDSFKNLPQADRWNDQFGGLFDGERKKSAMGPSAKYASHPEESTTFLSGRSPGEWSCRSRKGNHGCPGAF
jgi:hypothetical protein